MYIYIYIYIYIYRERERERESLWPHAWRFSKDIPPPWTDVLRARAWKGVSSLPARASSYPLAALRTWRWSWASADLAASSIHLCSRSLAHAWLLPTLSWHVTSCPLSWSCHVTDIMVKASVIGGTTKPLFIQHCHHITCTTCISCSIHLLSRWSPWLQQVPL